MPGLNDQQVDLFKHLRGEQTDIVLEGLEVVADIVKGAVAQHRAQGEVLIDQFVQAVVVAVQIEAKHAADQNLPERHAGASDELADLRCDPTFQQLEDRVAQRNSHVDEL
jgi:hypothetical protein